MPIPRRGRKIVMPPVKKGKNELFLTIFKIKSGIHPTGWLFRIRKPIVSKATKAAVSLVNLSPYF